MAASAQRFQALSNILAAGNTFSHGLLGTPTEYTSTIVGAVTNTQVYFITVGSTSVNVACTPVGAVSALICCSIPHSIIV